MYSVTLINIIEVTELAKEKSGSQRFPRIDIGAPLLEMTGNRGVCIEGQRACCSTKTRRCKISAGRMVVSFGGRGLRLRCISGSCVEISGFISKIEFLS